MASSAAVAVRILLIEDDEQDYLLTQKLLKDNARSRFAVTWARSYDAALEQLDDRKNFFDVCLVDYHLGDQTGLDLIERAIADGFRGPLILLTGRGDHDIDVGAMKVGAADYLVKGEITPELMDRVIRHSIERKGAQAALSQSEAQYRQIVEATSDGIIKIDAHDAIVFANRRFAEMLGYEQRAMIGMSVHSFVDDGTASSTDRVGRGLTDAVDTTLRHRDGTRISVDVASTRLVGGEGPAGHLAVVRDVTERKKLQSQLMVSDRMASVGTLAAGVAHEINNPLAAVIGNIEYISDLMADPANAGRRIGWLLDQVKGPFADARDGAERVRYIVRDLKIFSRSTSDEPHGPVDVELILESSLRMAWNEIRHRARLVKDYSQVPGVDANEARLGQVFLNLIVNAAQALPDGQAEEHQILVSTRLEGEFVVIEVSDTGAGISVENLGRIFDAFYTTKAVGVGTGLGLAICHRIVTDMGGQLTAESELGKGSTFRVKIPVAHGEMNAVAEPVEPVSRLGRRGRILLVDDELLVIRAVQRSLSREHDVISVVAAKEALALCVGGDSFDLILCDLMMPDMTGMDLHAELSRIAPEQASRMIFVTGGAFTAKARHFLSETPQEHMEKPFDPANLRAIVRRFLR